MVNKKIISLLLCLACYATITHSMEPEYNNITELTQPNATSGKIWLWLNNALDSADRLTQTMLFGPETHSESDSSDFSDSRNRSERDESDNGSDGNNNSNNNDEQSIIPMLPPAAYILQMAALLTQQ